MKKLSVLALLVGMFAASTFAHSAVAQTMSPAQDVSRASTLVAATEQINVQRQSIAAAINGQLSTIAAQLRTLAAAPMNTDDQRSAVLTQVQNLAAQVDQMSSLKTALAAVQNGEVSLLNLAKNYLFAAAQSL